MRGAGPSPLQTLKRHWRSANHNEAGVTVHRHGRRPVGEGHHATVRATLGDMMLHHNLNAGAGSASARNSLERTAKQDNERKAPPHGYARILRHDEHRQGAQQAGANDDCVECYRSAWTSRSSRPEMATSTYDRGTMGRTPLPKLMG
jgi:hypothetical protein